MEHRWGQRTSVDVLVKLVRAAGAIGMGRVQNVSASGAFVQTRLELPLLTPLSVEPIGDPSRPRHRCAGPAYVVRQDEAGVGIEWLVAGVESGASPGRGPASRVSLAKITAIAVERRQLR